MAPVGGWDRAFRTRLEVTCWSLQEISIVPLQFERIHIGNHDPRFAAALQIYKHTFHVQLVPFPTRPTAQSLASDTRSCVRSPRPSGTQRAGRGQSRGPGQSKKDFKEPNSNGLQPESDGLHPSSDGLQPSSDGL